MKPQAKGSGIVSETQKSRLTLGASKVHSKALAVEPSGSPQGANFHLQLKDVRMLLIPSGFVVNTERGTDPISIPFHVLPRDWALRVSQKPEWNWKWQRNNFLCRKSRASPSAGSFLMRTDSVTVISEWQSWG